MSNEPKKNQENEKPQLKGSLEQLGSLHFPTVDSLKENRKYNGGIASISRARGQRTLLVQPKTRKTTP